MDISFDGIEKNIELDTNIGLYEGHWQKKERTQHQKKNKSKSTKSKFCNWFIVLANSKPQLIHCLNISMYFQSSNCDSNTHQRKRNIGHSYMLRNTRHNFEIKRILFVLYTWNARFNKWHIKIYENEFMAKRRPFSHRFFSNQFASTHTKCHQYTLNAHEKCGAAPFLNQIGLIVN